MILDSVKKDEEDEEDEEEDNDDDDYDIGIAAADDVEICTQTSI